MTLHQLAAISTAPTKAEEHRLVREAVNSSDDLPGDLYRLGLLDIQDDKQNELSTALLSVIGGEPEPTEVELEAAALLTDAIEAYEKLRYRLPEPSPLDVVRFLADQVRDHGGLTDVFGSKRMVSDVLRGKRELTEEHINKLCARFHLSPEVFRSV